MCTSWSTSSYTCRPQTISAADLTPAQLAEAIANDDLGVHVNPATSAFNVNGGYWGMAVAESTGKLYAAPCTTDNVLIVNPEDGTTGTIAIAAVGKRTRKYYGIAWAPNTNKLYCAPADSRRVLEINPATNRTRFIGSFFPATSGKWQGVAYDPNTGKLFCTPATATAVLVINPRLRTTRLFGSLPESSNSKWSGMALDPVTRKMYCPPNGRSATSVLIIDPATLMDSEP